MNSWKASLVISCCSPGKCLLGWAGKQERALTGVCVGTRAPGSALSRPCVAAPGEFKQSGTAWVRPLFVLFSSFRDVFQGVFWEGQLPSGSRVVRSHDTECWHPVKWFSIFCALACPTSRMGILHFISHRFLRTACMQEPVQHQTREYKICCRRE